MTATTKFSLIALFAVLCMANAQGFQEANKQLAGQLDAQKAGLQIGSACPQQLSGEGQVLCAGNSLARCNGGQVSGPLQQCAGGLNCQVLPLVNSPGVSVTCTSDADKIARIGNGAVGGGNNGGGAGKKAAGGQAKGKKQQGKKGKGRGKKQQGKGKKGKGKGRGKGKGKKNNQNNNPGQGAGNGAAKKNAGGANGAGKNAGGNAGGFQQANKQLARQLDTQKAGLAEGSACPQQFNQEGAVLCAGNQLARCAGGQVAGPLQACAGGLNCQVLPLVNSPGVSVTCSSDADKNARING
ncbi:hypothetical protein BCR44DRAFT_1512637 [Catenaria anguillulae PL171]|uniref:SRCR domain-containing protein n=1 Tax=Catenaria anguillulae PL171 TaxID=765915 RepID=A0A1Y2HSK5_9FUNG|nr:hypothetical protein BCR44DRAFT_1512637 [Catenaria anguillulae PL171]